MPFPWTRRCGARALNVDCHGVATSSDSVQEWKMLRRQYMFMMRRQVRFVVLLLALTEAMRIGPLQLVYAGKHGYPAPGADDFGIAYTVGYFLSWLYVCLFMIVYVPLFSWWVPETTSDPQNPSTTMRVAEVIKSINLMLLPFTIGVCLAQYAYYTFRVFLDANGYTARNSRKAWLVRFFMLLGIAISTSTGYGAFQILADLDLAHVKCVEYMIVVLPVQINIGLLMGTIMQFQMEKRIARKNALRNAAIDAASVEEKAPLIEA